MFCTSRQIAHVAFVATPPAIVAAPPPPPAASPSTCRKRQAHQRRPPADARCTERVFRLGWERTRGEQQQKMGIASAHVLPVRDDGGTAPRPCFRPPRPSPPHRRPPAAEEAEGKSASQRSFGSGGATHPGSKEGDVGGEAHMCPSTSRRGWGHMSYGRNPRHARGVEPRRDRQWCSARITRTVQTMPGRIRETGPHGNTSRMRHRWTDEIQMDRRDTDGQMRYRWTDEIQMDRRMQVRRTGIGWADG